MEREKNYRSPNPWHNQDRPWEEFKWDMKHPREFFKAGWAGMNNRNPEITQMERFVGFALMGMGLLYIVLGIAILIGG